MRLTARSQLEVEVRSGSAAAVPHLDGIRASRRTTTLRVVALPTRRPHQSRHDLAFVVALTALLVVGVLGVLLFNTSMQQQSRLLDSQRARLASLTEQAQELRTSLDELDQPERIAQRAAALHMQPASRPVFLRVGPGGQLQVVNAPRPAAGPAHAG